MSWCAAALEFSSRSLPENYFTASASICPTDDDREGAVEILAAGRIASSIEELVITGGFCFMDPFDEAF